MTACDWIPDQVRDGTEADKPDLEIASGGLGSRNDMPISRVLPAIGGLHPLEG